MISQSSDGLIITFDTLVRFQHLEFEKHLLICIIEPLESDLARQVEYDMDEQGQFG